MPSFVMIQSKMCFAQYRGSLSVTLQEACADTLILQLLQVW